MTSTPAPDRSHPPASQSGEDLSLAPLPPGESLEEVYVRREPEPELDLSRVQLAPSPAVSRQEAERENDPAMRARLEKIADATPVPPPVAHEPWIQFTIRDMAVVSGCLAVGLALGRIDWMLSRELSVGAIATFLLGWVTVGVWAYVTLSETKSHGWKIAAIAATGSYLGAMASALLRGWLASPTA